MKIAVDGMGGDYAPEEIVQGAVAAAREHGVELVLNSPVTRIEVDGRQAKGIVVKDGSFHPADLIVSNADLPFVYNHLLPRSGKARRLNKKKYSCES